MTEQGLEDAIEEYKRNRESRELLFLFRRCIRHFAVDDQQGFQGRRGGHIPAPLRSLTN
jgi:hypothetical protein